MASESDKKIILLYVLDILKYYSDCNHVLTYADIVSKLEMLYGISPDVKSVARNVDTLIDAGYIIEKVHKKGCYLAERDFDDAEVMYLVDAIYSSKSISSREAKILIQKLIRGRNKYDVKKYKHIYKVDEVSRKRSAEMFKNIEVLDRAIEQGKKVAFQYNEYNAMKIFSPRADGKVFIMNPYFLVNNNGKYYLVCNYDKYDNLANYKVENISNIEILADDVKPIKSLSNMENFKQDAYINEHVYMMAGESVDAVIKLDNKKAINDVIDWFGDKVRIKETGEGIEVMLKVNEQALVYWALQYGTSVEVLSPESTREKIREQLSLICNKYGV